MKDTLKIISDSKNYVQNSKNFEHNIALIYKIDNDMLLKSKINYHYDGQLMGILDADYENSQNIKKICDDIIYEFYAYKFNAIFLDFKFENSVRIVSKLDEYTYSNQIPLYVPHIFANVVKYANIVVDMSISGGNVKSILEYAKLSYSNERVSAKISHSIRRFIIPTKNKEGEVLSHVNLEDKEAFFSVPLCTNYYTQMLDHENCEFVIFDDSNSFYKKLEILKILDIKNIFISSNDIYKYNINI